EAALESETAYRQPCRLLELGHVQQPREFVRGVGEIDERSTRRYGLALSQREMVERRLDLARLNALPRDKERLCHQASPLIKPNQSELGIAVQFEQRLAECPQRGFDSWRDGQRMGERGERARRHRLL